MEVLYQLSYGGERAECRPARARLKSTSLPAGFFVYALNPTESWLGEK